ncbi:MAG: FHA domain-containing protein [Phycisphaerales bacterium]|nr:FHA domain-containing protein [Phycisphaerales bacterium]
MSSEACTIVPLGACPAQPMQLQADGKVCIVGRSAGASIRLDHPSISRQHASFHFQNGRWTVTDLGSRHGTLLNGVALEPRQPMPLRGGDRIGLQPWALRFDLGATAAATVINTTDSGAGGTIVMVAPPLHESAAQRQLDLLIQSSISIYAASSEAEVSTAVTTACVEGTKCERALIVRVMGNDGRLEVIGAWPEGCVQKRPVSRTLVRAAMQGKPVRLSEDESFGAAQSIIGTGVTGALCIPITIDAHVDAFLYLDNFEANVNFDDVASFSQALGRWTGLAFMRLQSVELESRQRELLEELAVARQVQERMMGASSGSRGEVMWSMCSIPGQVVAGDIFGVHQSKTQTGVTVFLGDVSGKGLGPGLLMAAITAHLEAQLSAGIGAEKALYDLSNFVVSRATAGQFATFAMVEVDAVARKVQLFDAGHGYYLVVDHQGKAKKLEVDGGVPIGVLEDFLYEPTPISLDRGDRVLLFSDGLAEQRNEEGTMLGTELIAQALVGSTSCGEDVTRLSELLKGYAKQLKYADDVTIASVMLQADATTSSDR